MKRAGFGVFLALGLAASAVSAVQAQQVVGNEVRIGTLQDLSGPMTVYGKDLRNGMQMRVVEANAKGPIHGRTLKLFAEDSALDPRRAALMTQKLVNQDKIFVMAGSLGSAINNASVPIVLSKSVVNFFPAALSRDMYDPLHKLKFAFISAYYDQMIGTVPKLYSSEFAGKKACAIYQDDEYGLEILRGAEDGLKTINVGFAEKTSYKRGATDFSSQVAKLKAADCEFLVLGTLIRETIGILNEARKLQFKPAMVGGFGTYSDLIHKLGGEVSEGLYATMTVQHPYADSSDPKLAAWVKTYTEEFREAPTAYSVFGYVIIDRLIVALETAGEKLTTDSLVAAIESMKTEPDFFGMPALAFSGDDHLGSRKARLSQIRNGQWTLVLDYEEVN